MARANRHYVPGHVWHLTHRCHKREFLLKFSKDRLRWLQWLYEARKRYSLVILNVESALTDGKIQREACWTQSIATGSPSYGEAVRNQMGGFAIGRQIRKGVQRFELREPQSIYNSFFEVEKKDIEGENLRFWSI